jgi:NADH-quinone oxidoreductase subunit E
MGAYRVTDDEIRSLIATFPHRKSALLPLLHRYQNERGYVSPETMIEIAGILDLSPAQVYEVVSFYTLFHQKPVGRHLVQVCRTTSCYLCGAFDILDHLRRRLGIGPGETTADGRFTLEVVECIAWCHKAPVMQIDFDFYGDLTPAKVDEILEGLP